MPRPPPHSLLGLGATSGRSGSQTWSRAPSPGARPPTPQRSSTN